MALEGGEGSAARPGCSLPPGKTRYPLYRRLGGPQDVAGVRQNHTKINRDYTTTMDMTIFLSISVLTRNVFAMFKDSTFAHNTVYCVGVFQRTQKHFLLVKQSCWSMGNLRGRHKPWASKEAQPPTTQNEVFT